MKKKINYKRFGIVAVVLLITASAVAFIGYPSSSDSFTYQDASYQCSKNISGRNTINGFKPGDQQEFNKFCREYEPFNGVPRECLGTNPPPRCNVIEYRAVLDILRRDDVARTIEKYSTTQAWVRALGHKYIHDTDYLKRILPAYSNMKIDCIIVVHSPEGTRFFIENGETHDSHDDHRYIEVPAAEFLASLNNAPEADTANFWLGLH